MAEYVWCRNPHPHPAHGRCPGAAKVADDGTGGFRVEPVPVRFTAEMFADVPAGDGDGAEGDAGG